MTYREIIEAILDGNKIETYSSFKWVDVHYLPNFDISLLDEEAKEYRIKKKKIFINGIEIKKIDKEDIDNYSLVYYVSGYGRIIYKDLNDEERKLVKNGFNEAFLFLTEEDAKEYLNALYRDER